MKKLLCGLLCLLMLLGCASAEGYLYSAKGDNGLWGHIDETGNWVIPPKFDSAGDFRGNYAWIQQGDREGFANRDGEIVLLLDENVVADSGYDGFYYGGRETGIWLLYKVPKRSCLFLVRQPLFSLALHGKLRKLQNKSAASKQELAALVAFADAMNPLP